MNVAAQFDSDKVRPIELKGDMNTSEDVILAQVEENIRRGFPQVRPHDLNPHTALLVCGGPSLAMTEKELVDAHWRGGKIVAVNGAYQWCIDRNLKPSAAIMLDAREFNARFVETPVEGCRYLLASQCHARAFELCAERETFIWHACSAGDKEVDVLKQFYFQPDVKENENWTRTHPVTIGTTVGVRAVSLLRMLGFYSIELFGLDSCWLDGRHHSYEQAENNHDIRKSIWLKPYRRDDKAIRFECAPWHMQQAQDFMNLIKERGDHFQLNVHGPGLIATILRTGAEIQMENPQ